MVMTMKVKCPLCDFETDDAAVLYGHLVSEHTEPGSTKFKDVSKEKEEKEVYYCQICNKEFATIEECKRHILSEHKEEVAKAMKEELEKRKKKRKKK